MKEKIEMYFKKYVLTTALFLSASTAHSALVNYVTDPLTINTDSIVTTSSGVTITATAHHVEITPTTSIIYGPFPTDKHFTYTFGNGNRRGLGLNAEPVGSITPTEDDSGVLAQPGFDNSTRRGDFPTMQFALFEFSQPVDVSQIVLGNVSNFSHPIFVAAGASAPDLSTDLISALSGYSILSNPLSTQGGVSNGQIYNFTSLNSASFLVIGTSPKDDLGPFLADGRNSQFYINQIGFSAVPVPAAAWLFGSGLIGLIGFARRKANA